MAHQGERAAHADVPRPARADRGVDHRQPKRAARVMERAASDPGRPGGPQDVRGCLDRHAALSQPAAERPRAGDRRGQLVCRRASALRCAGVVFLHAFCRALRARAHRDPGGSPRAPLGGAAGARVESPPVTAPTIMPKRKRVISAVLAILGIPVLLVLVEAVSFRIAAVGLVAAAHLLPWEWCTDRRPVPMIAFHGTADPEVPYSGGRTWVAPERFPSIPTWTANWARRNRCAPNPLDSAVAADVTRRAYTHCADDAAVVLYTVRGGGHTWPGGKPLPQWFAGRTTQSIDATSLMWAFFREHPLRRHGS